MNVAARSGLRWAEWLGHEGHAHSLLLGHFLQALLVDRVAIRHRQRVGIAHAHFGLPEADFTLAVFDRRYRTKAKAAPAVSSAAQPATS